MESIRFLFMCFCFVALSCPCISRGASVNEWGDCVMTYEQLDAMWEDVWSNSTSEPWPGVAGWLNGEGRGYLLYVLSNHGVKARIVRTFSGGSLSRYNGVQFLGVHGSLAVVSTNGDVVFESSGLYPGPAFYEEPYASKVLVPSVGDALWSVPSSTNVVSDYIVRVRGALENATSTNRLNYRALTINGVWLNPKSVPFPWSGFFQDCWISAHELWDNGVENLPASWLDESPAIISEDKNFYNAFSNIVIRSTQKWR